MVAVSRITAKLRLRKISSGPDLFTEQLTGDYQRVDKKLRP